MTEAASAPQSAPSSGADSGGDSQGFDVNSFMEEARAARKESSVARKENSVLRGAFDKHSKEFKDTQDTVSRIKKAFVPDDSPKEADPIADLEQQMDYYLEQAMEAKTRGQAIPLTTNLALRFFQSQIENHKVQQKLMEEIRQLRGGVDHANNPENSINNTAYSHMENYIQQSLDNMYGTEPAQLGVKRNVYQGVVNMLQADLKELQQKAPHLWDQVRRDTGKLQRIVQKAVAQIVPPKARSIIEQQQLENSPMEEGELWAAFREAKQIKDPKKRQEVITMIRQDILSMQMNRKRRR